MKRIHLTACFAAATLAVLLLVPAAAAQSLKIGVFDPQRVSEETAAGKAVQAQLAAVRDEKQAQLSSKQTQLDDMQTQLEQQALTLSAEKRTALELQIQRLKLDLDNARKLASQELQLEVASAQNSFSKRLLAAVDRFGKEQGYDLILDTTIVAFVSPNADVTTGIIDTFDKLGPVDGGIGN